MPISPNDPLLIAVKYQFGFLLGTLRERKARLPSGMFRDVRKALKTAVLKTAESKELSDEQKLLLRAVTKVLSNFDIISERSLEQNITVEKLLEGIGSFIIIPIIRELRKSKDVRLKALARDVLVPFIILYEEKFGRKLL